MLSSELLASRGFGSKMMRIENLYYKNRMINETCGSILVFIMGKLYIYVLHVMVLADLY